MSADAFLVVGPASGHHEQAHVLELGGCLRRRQDRGRLALRRRAVAAFPGRRRSTSRRCRWRRRSCRPAGRRRWPARRARGRGRRRRGQPDRGRPPAKAAFQQARRRNRRPMERRVAGRRRLTVVSGTHATAAPAIRGPARRAARRLIGRRLLSAADRRPGGGHAQAARGRLSRRSDRCRPWPDGIADTVGVSWWAGVGCGIAGIVADDVAMGVEFVAGVRGQGRQ